MTLHPTGNQDPNVPADLGSAGTGTTAQAAPLSTRAAFAVLGSMIFLILALTGVLAESTWGHGSIASQPAPVLNHARLGSR
jgi:hypothetical protein